MVHTTISTRLLDSQHIEVFFYYTDTRMISCSIKTSATFYFSFISYSSTVLTDVRIFFYICDVVSEVLEIVFVCR